MNELRNYSDPDAIVRGSRWPPANISFGVQVIHPVAWLAAAITWTWTMEISRHRLSATPDLILTSAAPTLDHEDERINLIFFATPAQTEALPPGDLFYVEIKSDEGAGAISIYDCVAGTVEVREPAGEG